MIKCGKLHPNTVYSPSNINRSEFNKWRNKYWQTRGKGF